MSDFTNRFRWLAILSLSSWLIFVLASCGGGDDEDEPGNPDNPTEEETTMSKVQIGTPYYGDLSEYNSVASKDLHYKVYDNYNFVLTFKSDTKCEISMSGTQWKYSGYSGGDTYVEKQISVAPKSTTYSISGSKIYIDDYDPQYQLTSGISWSGTITRYGSIIHDGNEDIIFTPAK